MRDLVPFSVTPRRWGAVIITAALLVLPSVATAQTVAEYRRRLDSLTARLQVLSIAKQAFADSVTRDLKRLDTARAQGITILTPRSTVPVVEWALQHAIDDLTRRYGPMPELLREVTADRRLVARLGPPPGATYESWFVGPDGALMKATTELGKTARAPSQYSVGEIVSSGDELSRTFDLDSLALARGIAEKLLDVVGSRLPDELVAWAGTWAPNQAPPIAWAHRRVNLVSNRAPAVRRCFEGNVSKCSQVLEITPVADQILEFYDPDSRRALITDRVQRNLYGYDHLEYRRGSSRRPPDVQQCLDGSDADCIARMRKDDLDVHTLSAEFRQSLVEQAVMMGGPGALERLYRAKGGVAERIAAAAGVPVDSVVSAWRTHIATAQLPSDNANPIIAATAIGWTVLLTGLALRSSRWR